MTTSPVWPPLQRPRSMPQKSARPRPRHGCSSSPTFASSPRAASAVRTISTAGPKRSCRSGYTLICALDIIEGSLVSRLASSRVRHKSQGAASILALQGQIHEDQIDTWNCDQNQELWKSCRFASRGIKLVANVNVDDRDDDQTDIPWMSGLRRADSAIRTPFLLSCVLPPRAGWIPERWGVPLQAAAEGRQVPCARRLLQPPHHFGRLRRFRKLRTLVFAAP